MAAPTPVGSVSALPCLVLGCPEKIEHERSISNFDAKTSQKSERPRLNPDSAPNMVRFLTRCGVALGLAPLLSCHDQKHQDDGGTGGARMDHPDSIGGSDAGPSPSSGGSLSPEAPSGGMPAEHPAGGSPEGQLPSTGGGGAASEPEDEPRCDPQLSYDNRSLVGTALDELFVNKDLSAIDRYWSDPYLQHNPIGMSGVTAFRSLMSSFVLSTSFQYERIRTLADCDLVVVQGRYSQTGVIFDMFRVQDAKIVEHWDSDTNQASNAEGPSELVLTKSHDAYRAHVLEFMNLVLIDGAHDRSGDYLSATYVDRRSPQSLGPEALFDALENENSSYERVHYVIADNNFVFVLSEGKRANAKYAFYDLFRLEDEAIVERWDSSRPVPVSTASGLPIF